MVVLRTRIVLGTRETPGYVSREFFEAMHFVIAEYQYDFTLHPTTIEYKIPHFMVVERDEIFSQYSVSVCDSVSVPMCSKRKTLVADTYMHKSPKSNFDRFRVYTEQYSDNYYLLVPHAQYFDTCIHKDWTTRHVIYDSLNWDIHFQQVYVDPHDTRSTIWFFSHPKYQIEMICYHDFRDQPSRLKEAIMSMLPRSFR